MIDFSGLISQLFSIYWWLVPLLIDVALFKSAWFKGFIGEVMVNLSARLFLNKNDYHLIKNVSLPIEDAASRKRETSPVIGKSSTIVSLKYYLQDTQNRHLV